MTVDHGLLGRTRGVVVSGWLHMQSSSQGGFERSLGEELASPKTPSRILLAVLSTAILENDRATMYGLEGSANCCSMRLSRISARVFK